MFVILEYVQIGEVVAPENLHCPKEEMTVNGVFGPFFSDVERRAWLSERGRMAARRKQVRLWMAWVISEVGDLHQSDFGLNRPLESISHVPVKRIPVKRGKRYTP